MRHNHLFPIPGLFLMLQLAFLMGGAWMLVAFDKGFLTIWMNSWMSETTVRFFMLATALAEGVFITLVVGLLLFRSFGASLLMLVNVLLITLVIAFLKQVVFPEYHRPAIELLPHTALHVPPTLSLLRHHSFPSGHTAVAFGIFFLLSLHFQTRPYQALFFFLALLVGMSRVFLVQHFFIDVYFGSMIGTSLAACLAFAESRFRFPERWKWYQRSLLN